MATILVCDKCKCQMTDASYSRSVIVRNAVGSKLKEYDLCQSCYELIEDIILNPYKYDIKDRTADDPLKDHCVNTYRSL